MADQEDLFSDDDESPPILPLNTTQLLQLLVQLGGSVEVQLQAPQAEPAPPTNPSQNDLHAIQMLYGEESETDIDEELEQEQEQEPKRRRLNSPPIDYRYFQLNSLEEFYFSEEDGKNIVLPLHVEPNRIIRNIISILPVSVKDRLLYLNKFMKQNELVDEHQRVLCTNMREQVCTAYVQEYKLRWAFRNVLNRWRIHYMDKRFKKEIDPITLADPVKEVFVYDWSVKKKFVFDAKALSQVMETNLLYHEGGFALPKCPRNPWTNLPFTYLQLVSIYHQLHAHGELRWAFQTLRQYNFNKTTWQLYHHSTITLYGIKNSIRLLDTADARDLLEDFIFSKMDELHLQSSSRIDTAYRQGLLRLPTHWYIERFKHLAIMHYEAYHFNRSKKHIINPMCKELFKKQHIFIKDLVEKGIIPQ
jgi:hypothetical protein